MMFEYSYSQPFDHYDIVAAYIRHSLQILSTTCTETIHYLLPVKHKFKQPVMLNLVTTIKRIADRINSVCQTRVEKVIDERANDLALMLKLETEASVVREIFTKVMKDWLGEGGRRFSWERVVMCLDFTRSVVFQNVKQNRGKAAERIRDIVCACTDYLNIVMKDCQMFFSSDWRGLLEFQEHLLSTVKYDIPGTTQQGKDQVDEQNSPTSSSENETFDIVCAYIRNNLRQRNKVEGHLTSILPDIESSVLAHRETKYEETQILNAMIEFAHVLVPAVACNYNAVLMDWNTYIERLVDITESDFFVLQMFEKIMYAWLVDDGHLIGWGRVVMIIEFTAELIYAVAKRFGKCGLERMALLLKCCDEFISKHIIGWISANGGWYNIAQMKHLLLCQQEHDIPASCSNAVLTTPLEATEKAHSILDDIITKAVSFVHHKQREDLLKESSEYSYISDRHHSTALDNSIKMERYEKALAKIRLNRTKDRKIKEQLVAASEATSRRGQRLIDPTYIPDYTEEDEDLDEVFY